MNPPDDAWLDALLARGLKQEPLPDDGFTLGVLDSLTFRPATHSWIVLALAWAMAGTGIALGLSRSGAWEQIAGGWLPVVHLAAGILGDPWMSLVALAILASVALAWVPARSAFKYG
jgi:hypothetical protein